MQKRSKANSGFQGLKVWNLLRQIVLECKNKKKNPLTIGKKKKTFLNQGKQFDSRRRVVDIFSPITRIVALMPVTSCGKRDPRLLQGEEKSKKQQKTGELIERDRESSVGANRKKQECWMSGIERVVCHCLIEDMLIQTLILNNMNS